MGLFDKLEEKFSNAFHKGVADIEEGMHSFAQRIRNSSFIQKAASELREAEHKVSEIIPTHHPPEESHPSPTPSAVITAHPESVSSGSTSSGSSGTHYTPAMPVRTLGASHPELNEHPAEHHESAHTSGIPSHSLENAISKQPLVVNAHPAFWEWNKPTQGSIKNEPTQLIKQEMKEGKIKEGGSITVSKNALPDVIAHDLSQAIKVQTKLSQEHKEYNDFVANLIRKAEHNPFYQEELKLVAPDIMQAPKSTMHGYVGNPFEIAHTLAKEQEKESLASIHAEATNVLNELNAAIHNVAHSNANTFLVNGQKVSKSAAIAKLEQQKQKVQNWEASQQEKAANLAKANEESMIEQVAENVQKAGNVPVKVNVDVSSTKHTIIGDFLNNPIIHEFSEWNKEIAHTKPFRVLAHESSELIEKSKEFKEHHHGKAAEVLGDIGEVTGYGLESFAENPLKDATLVALTYATGGLIGGAAGALGEAAGIGAGAGQALASLGGLGVAGYSVAKSKNKAKALGESAVLMGPFLVGGALDGLLSESIEPEEIIAPETNIEHNLETNVFDLTSEGAIKVKRSRFYGLLSKEDTIPWRLDVSGNLDENKFALVGTKTVGEEETPVRIKGENTKLGDNVKFQVVKEGGTYKVPLEGDKLKMEVPQLMEQSKTGEKHFLTNFDFEEFDESGTKAKKFSKSVLSKHNYEVHRVLLGDDQNILPDVIETGKAGVDFTDFYGEGKGGYEYERKGKIVKMKGSSNFDIDSLGFSSPKPEEEKFRTLKLDLSKENKPNIERLIGTDMKDLDFVASNEPKISKSVPSTVSNEQTLPEFSVEVKPQEEPVKEVSAAESLSSEGQKTVLSPQYAQEENALEELAAIHHAVPESVFKEDLQNIFGDLFSGPSVNTANVGRIAASGIEALFEHNLAAVERGQTNTRVEKISPKTIQSEEFKPMSVEEVMEKPMLDVLPLEKIGMLNPQKFVTKTETATDQATEQSQATKLDVLNALTLEEPLWDIHMDMPFLPIIDFERESRIRIPKPHHAVGKGKENKGLDKYFGKQIKNPIASVDEFFGNLMNGGLFESVGKNRRQKRGKRK